MTKTGKKIRLKNLSGWYQDKSTIGNKNKKVNLEAIKNKQPQIMKRILFALFVLTTTGVQAQQQYLIKGDVSKIKEPIDKVYLSYYADGKSTQDSSKVINGKYEFKGMVSDPVMGNLRASYASDTSSKTKRMISYKRDVAGIFIENSKININNVDSFSNVTIKGSKAHAEYLKLKDVTKDVTAKMELLNKEYSELYKKKDEAGMKRVDDEFEKVDAEMKVKYKEYLKVNTSSPIGIYAFKQYAGYDINADDAEPIFLALSESIRNSAGGKEMTEKIEIAKKTGVGKMAMEFTQNDTLGNPVSLSSFRGKYLLIDFWASWCGPCRQENPNVVLAFNKYNNKGFDVLGVSLDQPTGKEKWLKAIHDDKLTWTQVSDLQYWKNAVSVMYGIQAIPQNFLLDPQGKIIGKNLRGEALNKKLEELFH
jgi:peroxiredoxin